MKDVSALRKIFRDKLEATDSMDAAFTKAVWVAFKEGLAEQIDEMKSLKAAYDRIERLETCLRELEEAARCVQAREWDLSSIQIERNNARAILAENWERVPVFAAPEPPKVTVAIPRHPSGTVLYDLSPAFHDSAIRDKLIELGWTPPISSDVMTPGGPAKLVGLRGLLCGKWTEAWVEFPDGVERWYAPENVQPNPNLSNSPGGLSSTARDVLSAIERAERANAVPGKEK